MCAIRWKRLKIADLDLQNVEATLCNSLRKLCSFCLHPFKGLPPKCKETSVHTKEVRGAHSKRQLPTSKKNKPQNKIYLAGTLLLDFVTFPQLWEILGACLSHPVHGLLWQPSLLRQWVIVKTPPCDLL